MIVSWQNFHSFKVTIYYYFHHELLAIQIFGTLSLLILINKSIKTTAGKCMIPVLPDVLDF